MGPGCWVLSASGLVKQVVPYVLCKGEETKWEIGVRRGVGESCPPITG